MKKDLEFSHDKHMTVILYIGSFRFVLYGTKHGCHTKNMYTFGILSKYVRMLCATKMSSMPFYKTLGTKVLHKALGHSTLNILVLFTAK